MKMYMTYTTKDECVVTMFQFTCSAHWNKMYKSMLLQLKRSPVKIRKVQSLLFPQNNHSSEIKPIISVSQS